MREGVPGAPVSGGLVAVVAILAAAVGCTRVNPEICCTTTEQCASVGLDELRPCRAGLVCGPDLRCEVQTDAAIDSARPRLFDFAYVNEWDATGSGTVGTSALLLIINESESTLSENTLLLESTSDDHPSATVRVMTSIYPNSAIAPGRSGGALTPLSTTLIVDSGLVTEPRVETDADYLSFAVLAMPAGTYDIHATVVMKLSDHEMELPFVVHHVDGQTVALTPHAAKRLTAFAP